VPWTLRVWSAHPEQDLREIGEPRGLIFLLISLAAFLVLAGAYFVARGVRREVEVARLQSDFVSAVSHEFRTPLTSMSHLVELLRGRPDMDEGRRAKYYDALEQEASRLRRFVDQLLDFGRVDAGAAQYRFEPADPVALVSGVVDRFRESPGARGHAVQFSAVGPASLVRVDAEAFALALNNLLENAAKYSAVDAPIDVLVVHEPPSARVRVDVRDAGPGIPLTEQAIIFEKFVRGAGAQSSGVRGTGVGLALAREIVRAHDGDITVESVVGQGSRFTIALPAMRSRRA
jgi:signal transduction histidine kinase